MSAPSTVSFVEKLSTFQDYWNPRVVGSFNGNDVRLARIKGEFTWHSHAESDELFMVISGRMKIEFRDAVRELGEGEMIIVQKGVEHRPLADEECHILMLDREGEPNTGGNPSQYTRAALERI